MTKFIAIACLVVLLMLNTLGNYWFTYGIWPRSWGALALFTFTTTLLSMSAMYVTVDGRAPRNRKDKDDQGLNQ